MTSFTIEQAMDLAIRHHQAGRLAEAEAIYRRVLEQIPQQPDALHMLGVLAYQTGRHQVALDLITRASNIDPALPGALNNLALVFHALGKPDEALSSLQRAATLDPASPQTQNNLGNAFHRAGRLNEAVNSFQKAIQLQPDFGEAYSNLGHVLQRQGELDSAADALLKAISLKPQMAQSWNNLGGVRKDQALIDEALQCYRQATALNPDYAEAQSNLLFATLFHPVSDNATIAAEHRRWNQVRARPLASSIQPHTNNRDPARRLRIGYVSADFREHPVGRFMLPILKHHDHGQFQVHCYSNAAHPDSLTNALKSYADEWHSVVGLADAQLADRIRQDQIDILIDLAGHSAGNRLLMFARKPAPVQMTYLAYCATTGLETIDYRITDPHLDPPGANDAHYSERSLYLPKTYWCYPPPEQDVPCGSLPAMEKGHVTFGCLNNFGKLSEPTLRLWCELLRELPGSRLILHTSPGSHRNRVIDLFAGQQIDPVRLNFAPRLPLREYLELHHRIDVALDPFPFNGGTTSCDALWMGVPIITLAGERAVSRAGLSLLANLGLTELVAHTPALFLQTAIDLAKDLPRLAQLREGLRERMRSSPLMDARAFACDIERLYRDAWKQWCMK